ncbi:MAG: nucleotide exchange factor GrpE [Dehalococcoidia bacterium]
MAEEPVIQEQENVEELKKAVVEEKDKASSYLASLQRSEADFRNYKKRIEQEKQEALTWTNAELIKSLLPVVDDMERAISMMDPAVEESSWGEGFKIIQRNMQDILRAHGCSEIECVGKPFDPNLHEAIGYEDGEEGMIISEHGKGYTMKNKVLRASQVTVGKGKPGGANTGK